MIINKIMKTSILSFFKDIDSLKKTFTVLYSNDREIDIVIRNFYQSFFREGCFKKYYLEMFERYGVSFLEVIVTKENLLVLIQYLISCGLNIDQIRMAIVDNPGLIFMVKYLEKLHVVFKGNEYYGLIISDENQLYSYYGVNDKKDLIDRETINNDFSNDTYLVKKLNSFFQREDAKDFFDFDIRDSSAKRLIKIMENDNLSSGFKIR